MNHPAPSGRLAAEYVLPLRWPPGRDPGTLTAYLCDLSRWLDITVVDGSEPEVFDRHHRLWSGFVRHLRPHDASALNGKVAGVLTGVRLARHEAVVIGDDDVRWRREQLRNVVALLGSADLVRPQNYFDPRPWHARWDTARSLINRAFASDYPGTYAVRRSTFERMGGYDGNVLFENLELSRTVAAAGGIEHQAIGLLVQREPPSAQQFRGQRVRQAYDSWAQPARLLTELSLLPSILVLIRWAIGRSSPLRGAGLVGLLIGLSGAIALAERGRRRPGGRDVFPATAALWAPLWVAERAVCSWLALARRLTGGVPYAGHRLTTAAHSPAELRRRWSDELPRFFS